MRAPSTLRDRSLGRALVLSLALVLAGPRARAAPAEPDWAAAGAETARLLSAYLQVDTTSPPGGELAGAQHLAAVLAADGIVAEIDEFAPGRANLVARLPARRPSGAGAVCLLSHIDVVTAVPARWDHPPLSGHIDADGVVWGRGALDMKGMGAVELEVMLLLARRQVELDRDVVLLAVADEEVDNQGILRAISRWEQIGCTHAVNEGGVGIRDMFFEGQVVFPISVGEKGYVWGQVVAEGEPGHGSTPIPDRAPERLVRAWQALAAHDPAPRWDPALIQLLDAVGAQRGGLPGFILQRPALVRMVLRRKLMGNPLTRAVLTDTINVTGFSGAEMPNVVPAEVRANVDARILPGTTPEQHVAVINALLGDLDGVRFEVRSSTPGGASPVADPFYAALAAQLQLEGPQIAVGPAISPGFTDSIHLRRIGVHAYGLVPFILTEEELRTMHGDNERVSTENLERGVRVLYRALITLAAPR
jgi:acetylornithine deacetylase/succinyl-diaminopimelate desuccinylase-like protein